jgi:hypothetical protein
MFASSLPTSICERNQRCRRQGQVPLPSNPTFARGIWIKSKHLFVSADLHIKKTSKFNVVTRWHTACCKKFVK